MSEFYLVDIAGRKENLPIITLASGVKIAYLNLHGNASLTEFCGKKIAKLLENSGAQILLTAESKGLQLTHVVARELFQDTYIVARKGRKIYMDEYVSSKVKAITGEASYELFISKHDASKLCGKKVAIVDDVISSGGSLSGMEELVAKSGGTVVAKACVLAEGEAGKNDGILRLGEIPLL